MSLPSAVQLPAAVSAEGSRKGKAELRCAGLTGTCLPAGFHANVNNLLALIPLVAHLHNDTVHYRMEYFHYKVRLEGKHIQTVTNPAPLSRSVDNVTCRGECNAGA